MKLIISNKKGQEESGGFPTAIGLGLLAVGAVVLILLVKQETLFASDLGDAAACYTSIIGSMFSSEETTTKCPVANYEILSNGVKETKNGKTRDSDKVKDFSTTDSKINELFAKLMGECIQMGGGVNSKAFSSSLLEGTVCLKCSNIEFDRSIGKYSFSGLREYLEKNNAPGKDKKYADIFNNNNDHKEAWIDFSDKNNLIPAKYGKTIDASQLYSVFFIGIKEGNAKGLFWDFKLFDRQDTYFVYAATADKAHEVCNKEVN